VSNFTLLNIWKLSILTSIFQEIAYSIFFFFSFFAKYIFNFDYISSLFIEMAFDYDSRLKLVFHAKYLFLDGY